MSARRVMPMGTDCLVLCPWPVATLAGPSEQGARKFRGPYRPPASLAADARGRAERSPKRRVNLCLSQRFFRVMSRHRRAEAGRSPGHRVLFAAVGRGLGGGGGPLSRKLRCDVFPGVPPDISDPTSASRASEACRPGRVGARWRPEDAVVDHASLLARPGRRSSAQTAELTSARAPPRAPSGPGTSPCAPGGTI